MKKILVSIFLLVFGLCLVGCESTLRGEGEYKLTVIDDFGYLVKPLDKYYKAGEEVEVHLAFLSGPSVGININGEYIGESADTKHVDGYPVITFIMPDKDSILYTTCNGYILKDCGEDNHQWDEGREIEAGNGGYVMKYFCELCGKFKEETITIIPPQESWPDDPLLIVRNNEGKIVFSAIALTGDSCDIKYTDLNKNKTIDAKNKNEILNYLIEILYGRESVYDYTNSYLDCSIKITYDMPNSLIVLPNTYEFKFSSENGPMTIIKNGDLIGTVILSIDEVNILLEYMK